MAREPKAPRKDYTAIASQRIIHPGTGEARMPRILVYGRNKKGKSRFACTAPNVLVLDPDDNPNLSADRWPIDRWDDINEAYSFLRSGKHQYEWVALDGITRMHNMALRWVMRQAEERNLDSQPVQTGIQHYGRANEMIRGVIHNFHAMRNLGIIFTAQERVVGVTELDDLDDDDATPASYQFIADLSPRARTALNAVVDLTGRIYVVKGEFTRKVRRKGEVVVEEYTRERRLWIGPEEQYETGYRSDHVLPDFIPNPTVVRVVRAMREGVVK
jgi:hypothetical protein